MNDYRVTVKVRNANLLRCIERAGFPSVPKFCEAAGVSYAAVNDLVNMAASPLLLDGSIRPVVMRVIEFAKCSLGDAFADCQIEAIETNRSERDVSAEQVWALMGCDSQDPSELIEFGEMAEAVNRALEVFRPKHREIVEARAEGKTYAEIASRYGLSVERVRQIDMAAHRRLRRDPSLHQYSQYDHEH